MRVLKALGVLTEMKTIQFYLTRCFQTYLTMESTPSLILLKVT